MKLTPFVLADAFPNTDLGIVQRYREQRHADGEANFSDNVVFDREFLDPSMRSFRTVSINVPRSASYSRPMTACTQFLVARRCISLLALVIDCLPSFILLRMRPRNIFE